LDELGWFKTQFSKMLGFHLESIARFGRFVTTEFSIRDRVEVLPEFLRRADDSVYIKQLVIPTYVCILQKL
jgi:hypothetical protein